MTSVSWYEADAYARWAGGRLPSEAEREYAARGEEGRRFPWGDDEPSDQHANFDQGSVMEPLPVGIYPRGATSHGVQDLAGNVWEWCGDWYKPYRSGEHTNPTGPPTRGSERVVRGGAFYREASGVRSAYRFFDAPSGGGRFVGFRCAWPAAAGPN